jgi:hypothetical protein
MTSREPPPSIADAWRSGHTIGSFELRGAISRSASGIVYRAWDHALAIDVAIKEHLPTSIARRLPSGDVVAALPNAGTAYDSSLQAFIEASRALAQCDHPALVRVLHLQTAHGTAYRVMPWVDGEPLRERRYAMSQPPDEPMLRALLDDLLGALEAFHCTGIVHGGVHPSQIMLLRNERALLLGPCAVAADVGGAAPGPWTDLRALADVARFCISGMPPTPDGQPVEPTARIVERLLVDDSAVRYGQEFMRVLDAAASPDIAQRPQSVAQFRERLRLAARVDAGLWADDRLAQAETRPPEVAKTASDAAVASMIQRAIDSIPPRVPVKPRRRRAGPESAPIGLSSLPASEPSIDPTDLRPLRRAAPPRRHARLWARVAAVLLAVVGYAAWQWLYRPVPADLPLAVSEVAAPAPSVAPAPAPVIVATPLEPVVPPVNDTGAPAAIAKKAPPVEVTPIGPRSAPAEQATVQPVPPVHSPREACGERTQFSLYLCMQQQCARSAWASHPQCVRLRATDEVE